MASDDENDGWMCLPFPRALHSRQVLAQRDPCLFSWFPGMLSEVIGQPACESCPAAGVIRLLCVLLKIIEIVR